MDTIPKKHHVLITGTGRAGTTFLVKLLTMLDIDTGFTKDFITASTDMKAGLEHQGLGGDLPYVIKNPKLMWQLPELLKDNPVVIDHILIPMREIHAAAESRRANLRKRMANQSPQDVVGGLEGVDDPAEQEAFFLEKFFDFFAFLSGYHIPFTLLHYPRLIYDGTYLYRKLHVLLGDVCEERFLAVFQAVSDPSLVNRYNTRDAWTPCYDDSENIQSLVPENGSSRGEVMQLQATVNQMKSRFTRLEKELTEENQSLLQECDHYRLDNQRIRSTVSWRVTFPFRVSWAVLRGDKGYLGEAAKKIENVAWKFRQNRMERHPRISRHLIEPAVAGIKKLVRPAYVRLSSCPEQWTPTAYRCRYEENQDFSSDTTDVKAIAFYQPVFCPGGEGTAGGASGISEWQLAKQGAPLFKGHYQPREPHGDLGYYNLTDIRTLKRQADLARSHGIYGFCFYYYLSRGARYFTQPIELLLKHPEIDIHYCLCWRAENPTVEGESAGEAAASIQARAIEDGAAFIRDAVRYIRDGRYIRVNGRPVVMVYPPLRSEDAKSVFEQWRQYCRENGIGDIAIWVCRGGLHRPLQPGLTDAADAEVEIPPALTVPMDWVPQTRLKDSHLKLPVADYPTLVNGMLAGETVADKAAGAVYRTVMPGLDTTARRQDMGRVYWGFSPLVYYKWLSAAVDATRRRCPADERFMFINGWNDWADGAYLEPDRQYGYAVLNTTSRALFDLPAEPIRKRSARKRPGTYQTVGIGPLLSPSQAPDPSCRTAVHAHVFYPELLDELIYYMNHIPVPFDCCITTDTESKRDEIARKTAKRLDARRIEIRVTPNVGRDVAPFLVECGSLVGDYDYLCHIHTKKSMHRAFGNAWREHLLEYLLGSRKLTGGILAYLDAHEDVGLIYPPVFSGVDGRAAWGDNKQQVRLLLERLGLRFELPEELHFPAGTMFWMRTKAFENLFGAGITYDDFEAEAGQLDGTLAHAFERAVVCVARHNGYACVSLE